MDRYKKMDIISRAKVDVNHHNHLHRMDCIKKGKRVNPEDKMTVEKWLTDRNQGHLIDNPIEEYEEVEVMEEKTLEVRWLELIYGKDYETEITKDDVTDVLGTVLHQLLDKDCDMLLQHDVLDFSNETTDETEVE